MLKTILYYANVILFVPKIVDWMIGPKNKAKVSKALDTLVLWLDYARPMDWLALKMSRLNNKKFATITFFLLIAYVLSRVFAPGIVSSLREAGILTLEHVIVFFFGIWIAGFTCTRLLAPLIIAKKYILLTLFFIVGIALYLVTGYVVKHEPAIMSLILERRNLITGKYVADGPWAILNIFVFVYGCILWIGIVGVLIICLFTAISLSFILLSLILRITSKIAWWILSSKAQLLRIAAGFGLFVSFIDILVKRNNAEDERKEKITAPMDPAYNFKRS